jgi:hypothetical protein
MSITRINSVNAVAMYAGIGTTADVKHEKEIRSAANRGGVKKITNAIGYAATNLEQAMPRGGGMTSYASYRPRDDASRLASIDCLVFAAVAIE